MKRLAIFLITIFTMFSCEDFYKDNGCIEMYEGNTSGNTSSGNTQSNSQNGSQNNYQNSYTVYFYPGDVEELSEPDLVYVYSWDYGETNAEFPGEIMNHLGTGWYEATINYSNVIFTVRSYDGTHYQTRDLNTRNGDFIATDTSIEEKPGDDGTIINLNCINGYWR